MPQMRVVVELQGGLGNQLFGWAAGFALSKKLQCELIIDKTNLYQRGYQLDQFEFGGKLATVRKKNYLRQKFDRQFYGRVFEEKSFEYDERFSNITDSVILRGYFQSWKYHIPYQDEIYGKVSTLATESVELKKLREKINFGEVVAIHVRRGDYKALEEYHGTIKNLYYKNALDELKNTVGTPLDFIVFSDEPELARSVVPGAVAYLGPADLTSPAETMVLMSSCRALIGANSSFSLWAALLMTPESKFRIFPNPWFAKEGISDKDLVPENFIKLRQA